MAGRKTQNTRGNSRSPARSSERNPARSSARKSARNPEPKKSTGNAMALAILLWIAAAAMLLAILGGETGLRKIVCGIGGSWSIGLPVILIWLGILSASSAKGKRLDGWRICLNIAAIVLAYTARHMFEAERIIEGSQLKSGGYYINFIARSYREQSGGGALGALLGWFFYQHLGGRWVGFFLCLLGIVACMTATGRTQKILDWGQARYAEYAREREPRKREPIRDEALEHAFDDDESDDEPDEAPVRRPRSAAEKPRSASPRAEMPRLRQKLYNVEMSSDTRPKRTSAQKPKPEPDPLFPEEDAEAAEIVPPTEEIPIPEEIPPTEEIEEPIAEDMPKPTESDIPQYLQKPKPVREEAASKPVPNPILNPIPNAAEEAAIMEKYRIEPEKYEPEEEPQAETKQEPDFLLLPDLKKWKKPVHEEKEEEEVYPYPPIDLLNAGDEKKAKSNFKQDEEKANRLVQTLLSFGIETKLTGIAHGPVVTRYELQPAEGVKVSRITALTDDIALRLAAESVRLEAPIPGKEAVGVEVPNDERETVSLRDVLESEEARKHPSKIAIGLGKDNSGRFIVADIAKMPHVLIAGQTGSGKSVCINSLIVSILYRASPDEVKLILIDPKVVELSVYNGIPHLIAPVVTDPKKAASALDWAVSEMMDRYKRFAERGVRDIKGYNKKLSEGEKCMPQVVIVIDELSDLMMVAPGDVEDAICRLAQLARAAGMHIVIATQRPSVNVITGIIKANIPTRIAFSVASQIDSRTMIDHGGAEKLLGRGDMLYVPSGMKPMRVQGVWVSDDEVERVVEYIKSSSTPEYNEDMLEHMENATRTDAEKEEVQDEYDSKLPEAVEIVIEAGQASASMLQRRMKVGYARAGRMMDEMEQRGIIAPPDGANKSKPRNVLITREQFQRMFEDDA